MPILVGVLIVLVIIIILKGMVIVKQAQVIVIERLGRYHATLDSGLHIIWPIVDKIRLIKWRYVKTDYQGNTYIVTKSEKRIDLRETVYDFPKQNVITADNVSIEIKRYHPEF